jgi:hypothetical protein
VTYNNQDFMKFTSNRGTFILILVALAGSKRMQAEDPVEDTRSGWYGRAGAVARFNVKATMKAQNPVLPAGSFDDGFVRPDRGESTQYTSNWGYNNASQIVGDNLVVHRYDNVKTVGENDLGMDDPLFGGEIIGGYRFSGYKVLGLPAHFGLELGYGFSRFSQDVFFSATGTSSYTVASYSLNGVVPPIAPYAGTDSGDGPQLDVNSNSSTTVSSAATTTFEGNVETTFQSVRIGPSLELDLLSNLTLGFSFGYSSVYVDGKVDYTQTTTFANPAVPTIASKQNFGKVAWEPGVFVELNASFQFSRYVGAFVGGDFQYNKSLAFGDGTHDVRIDLGSTYAGKAGVIVRF